MDLNMISSAGNFATVALGLGFVIFIHELGHFLLAKWNKVRVEMFSLGFGPSLLSYRKGMGLRLGSTMPLYERWLAENPRHAAGSRSEAGDDDEGAVAEPPVGETEYSLRLIPLGGFVKMLGEGEESGDEIARSTDPRAYPNKSVGARMAIISAGVIMNVISGLMFFVWVFGRGGLPVIPAKVGLVLPGHPAYQAGLRPGDTIETVNGRRNPDYVTLKRMTAMSGQDETLHLGIRRPGVQRELTIDVQPQREPGALMKTIGILPPTSLELDNQAIMEMAGNPAIQEALAGVKSGSLIRGAGPENGAISPVANSYELYDKLYRFRNVPVALELVPGKKGGKSEGEASRVTLPTVPYVDFGIRFAMGPVAAVQPGSPASKAGIQVGDRIQSIQGLEVIDPLRLAENLYDRAGEDVQIVVERSEGGKPPETLSVVLKPEASPSWLEPTYPWSPRSPQEIAPLGLGVTVEPKVAEVREGSPAARAGIRVGDTIDSLSILVPAKVGEGGSKTFNWKFRGPEEDLVSWQFAFAQLQYLPREPVEVRVNGGSEPMKMTAEPNASWFHPVRGFQFPTENAPLQPMGVTAALRRGLQDTGDTITSVYSMLRGLVMQSISPKTLGGPITIFQVASQTVRMGLVPFVHFLGVLSLNLAVLNFLPIPPLDGGQMVFLLAEKLRGRPLPEKALSAGMIAGLIFVLGLMAFVIYNEVVLNFFT